MTGKIAGRRAQPQTVCRKHGDDIRFLPAADFHADKPVALKMGAGAHLKRDGLVGVEIGSRQKTDVIAVFAAHGLRLRSAARDLAGHDRALVFGF